MSSISDILESLPNIVTNFHSWPEPEDEDVIIDLKPQEEDVTIDPVTNEEVFSSWPTQKEVNDNIKRKAKQEAELKNQLHNQTCGGCVKAVNQSPNPKSRMLYCMYNGLMVNRFQPNCDRFKEKERDAWEPNTE